MRPGGSADRRGVARRFGAKGHKCKGLVCRAVSGALAIIGTSLRHVAMRLRRDSALRAGEPCDCVRVSVDRFYTLKS
jgi:hypothetical protein